MNKNSPIQQAKHKTTDNSCSDSQYVKAQIIWTLKTVISGYSIRSNNDLAKTLSAMSPEGKSIKTFNLAQTKSIYAVNYGLAPFFKSLLYENLTRLVFHVYCFDKSLNEVTQTCEIRYSVCFLN